MHLLNVHTLKLETFHDDKVPPYAILSHTWEGEEVTFQDIQDLRSPATTKLASFEKTRQTCERAKSDGYHYWYRASLSAARRQKLTRHLVGSIPAV